MMLLCQILTGDYCPKFWELFPDKSYKRTIHKNALQ